MSNPKDASRLSADDKLQLLRRAWVRHICAECHLDRPYVENLVNLAELNGLFDAAKETFASESVNAN